MYRYLYWGGENSLEFAVLAMDCLKKWGLDIDERVLLSWGLDADDSQLVDHYLNKFFTMEKDILKPFRDQRVSETGELFASQDFPLSPDLHVLLGMVVGVSSKEMIRTVLRYAKKPLPSYIGGQLLLSHVCFRQMEPIDDIRDIICSLVEAGVDVKATGNNRQGPLQNAVSWNNSNLADVLLDYELSLADVQLAMEGCVRKGSSLTAERIMSSIFQKRPQILTIPLPKQDFDHFQLPTERLDFNYLRAICSRSEFSQPELLHSALLGLAIQITKDQPGGRVAIRERLDEFGNLLMTPLHHAAKHGNVEAAKLLLEEGANINAYSIYPAKGESMDLSAFTCTSDLSKLDDKQRDWVLANSGTTPLDEANDRDWDMSLYQWLPSDQRLLLEFRFAGGANKEEAAYEARTRTMINFLRENHAKTRFEIFGKPESRQRERDARLKDSRVQYRKKHTRKSPSDTYHRIFKFWGAAAALHSAQPTLHTFPDLISRADPTRPRYSELFADSITLFDRVLSSTSQPPDNSLHVGIETELSRYRNWAQNCHLDEGKLDEIADVPPLSISITLSASIFVCLREITCTLSYIEELLSGSPEPPQHIR